MRSGAPGRRAPVRGFSPARALLKLGVCGAGGLGLSGLYATTGFGLPCPLRTFTGWDCPLCGGTRLGGALLHGDLSGAFTFNPLVFLGLVVLAVLALVWLVELAGGPRLRPPLAIAARLRRLTPIGWLVFAVSLGVLYSVLRTLYFPV